MQYLCLALLLLCVSFLNSGKAEDECNITVTDEMRLNFRNILKEMKAKGEINNVCADHVVTETDPDERKKIRMAIREKFKNMDEEKKNEVRECFMTASLTAMGKMDEEIPYGCLPELMKGHRS